MVLCLFVPVRSVRSTMIERTGVRLCGQCGRYGSPYPGAVMRWGAVCMVHRSAVRGAVDHILKYMCYRTHRTPTRKRDEAANARAASSPPSGGVVRTRAKQTEGEK